MYSGMYSDGNRKYYEYKCIYCGATFVNKV